MALPHHSPLSAHGRNVGRVPGQVTLGFRVSGLGFSLGFRVQGLRLRVWGLPAAEKTYHFKGHLLWFLYIAPLKGRSIGPLVGLRV